MATVLAVGDVGVDVFLTIDHLPGADEKLTAAGHVAGGGMAGNVAAAVQTLGTSAAVVAQVGDDALGRFAYEDLRCRGVDVSGISTCASPTFFAVILLQSTGEKSLILVPTPAFLPQPEQLQPQHLQDTRLLYTTAASPALARRALALAKEAGAATALDLEAADLPAEEAVLRQLLAAVDLLFLNHRTWDLCCARYRWATPPTAWGPSVAVITRGQGGATVFAGRQSWEAPGYQVQVRDTTGAGDCFAGALIHATLRGWPADRAAQFASAAAALSVTAVGARGALPNEAAVQAFLAASAR